MLWLTEMEDFTVSHLQCLILIICICHDHFFLLKLASAMVASLLHSAVKALTLYTLTAFRFFWPQFINYIGDIYLYWFLEHFIHLLLKLWHFEGKCCMESTLMWATLPLVSLLICAVMEMKLGDTSQAWVDLRFWMIWYAVNQCSHLLLVFCFKLTCLHLCRCHYCTLLSYTSCCFSVVIDGMGW